MNNLDKQYKQLLSDVMEFGTDKSDRTGTGTRSIFGYTIRHNMKDGFPLLTTKKMYWKGIVTELLWFLRGDTNIKFLVDHGCHIWDGDAYKAYDKWNDHANKVSPFGPVPKLSKEDYIKAIELDEGFADKFGKLGPIYGKQWRSWTKYEQNTKVSGTYDEAVVDQFANLINDLKTNPDSRRLMVTAWNPGELDQMTLPPCHYGFQVYTRELSFEEKLQWVMRYTDVDMENLAITERAAHPSTPTRAISLMWNQRSVDSFLGLPFNIASYGLLLRIIAELVNMVPDQLIGSLGDVHIYSNHFDQVNELLTREPYPLPDLNINTEWWQTEIGECGEGPLDTDAFLKGLQDRSFIGCLMEEDIQLGNYKSHPAIKAPLSN
jgi:thymidylate synthase